jgi:hypothetical protein
MTVQADKALLYGLTDIDDPTSVKPVKVNAQGELVTSGAETAALGYDVASMSTVPRRGTSTNRSGSITTGGTAQPAMAANTATRDGYFFQNISTADLWCSWSGTAAPTAAGSFVVPSRGSFSSGGVIETEALSVYGATTGQAWTAWEIHARPAADPDPGA